jgi:hypothetical protein
VAVKQVRVSDLSGRQAAEDEFVKLIVHEHPQFQGPITLDVLPEELGELPESEQDECGGRPAAATPSPTSPAQPWAWSRGWSGPRSGQGGVGAAPSWAHLARGSRLGT